MVPLGNAVEKVIKLKRLLFTHVYRELKLIKIICLLFYIRLSGANMYLNFLLLAVFHSKNVPTLPTESLTTSSFNIKSDDAR